MVMVVEVAMRMWMTRIVNRLFSGMCMNASEGHNSRQQHDCGQQYPHRCLRIKSSHNLKHSLMRNLTQKAIIRADLQTGQREWNGKRHP